MNEIVQRFEGDNIKTRHSGKGSVFFSVSGFSFGLSAEYSKTLTSGGKTRDVNGKAAGCIGKNVENIEAAQKVAKMARTQFRGVASK